MESLVNVLRTRFPNISYREGSTFCWSPRTREVFYVPSQRSQSATWSLLHETAHALLGHIAYQTDFELVRMEVAAWEKAKDIGEAMMFLLMKTMSRIVLTPIVTGCAHVVFAHNAIHRPCSKQTSVTTSVSIAICSGRLLLRDSAVLTGRPSRLRRDYTYRTTKR